MIDHSGFIYVAMKPSGYTVGYTTDLEQVKEPVSEYWHVNEVRACEKAIQRMFKSQQVLTENQCTLIRSTVRKWIKDHPRQLIKPTVLSAP